MRQQCTIEPFITHNLLDTLGFFWTFHWTHVRQFTVVQNHKKPQSVPGGWGNSCYLINFATISLVVLLTIPYFLQKKYIRFLKYKYATTTTPSVLCLAHEFARNYFFSMRTSYTIQTYTVG